MGAPLGPEQCQANLIIIVTPDPKQGPSRPGANAVAARSSMAPSSMTVRRFIETDHPVRAWYNARVDDSHGVALTGANVVLNHMGGEAGNRATVNSHASDTRIELGTVKDLAAVFLFVDAHSVEHVQIGQLADYLGNGGAGKARYRRASRRRVHDPESVRGRGRPSRLRRRVSRTGMKRFCERSTTPTPVRGMQRVPPLPSSIAHQIEP